MSGKDDRFKNRDELDTTEEIPRGKFAAITPVSQPAYLEMIDSKDGDKKFELGEREMFIGRTGDCDIPLEIQNVSRKHARLFFQDEEYVIQDLESKNGVFVNGIKVVKCLLRNNDQIEVGGVKMIFHEGERLLKK